MNAFLLRSLCLASLLAMQATAFSTPTDDGTVAMTFTGIKNRTGALQIQLFDQPDGFPSDPKKALMTREIVLANLPEGTDLSRLRYEFEKLKPGVYAVSALWDKNSNRKMDKNFLGAPREPVGVSKNVRPRMSYPRFKDASFEVKAKERVTLEINLR